MGRIRCISFFSPLKRKGLDQPADGPFAGALYLFGQKFLLPYLGQISDGKNTGWRDLAVFCFSPGCPSWILLPSIGGHYINL